MPVISPEVKLEVTNVNDFLHIEDSYLPADLLFLRHMPRFVVYQVVDLIPPASPMSSDDFAEDLKKRKKLSAPKWTAVEYQSQKPVKECEPEHWMSFMDATNAAATVGAHVGFVYANFGAGEDLDLIPPQVIAHEAGLTVWGLDRKLPVWHVRKQPFIVAPNDEIAERFLQAAEIVR